MSLRGTSRASTPRGLSLVEVVISIFLLSFVALSVLSMTQTGFVAQKRNQQLARASLVAQSVLADIRLWASNIDNYAGNWAAYNRKFTLPDYPGYEINVRSMASGRPLDTPCEALESQYASSPQGKRTMPSAVKPVEITVSWSSDPRDSFQVLTYVGEPLRDVVGVQFDFVGPGPDTLAQGDSATYSVKARDSAGRPFPNFLFTWRPDSRYLTIDDGSRRDGSICVIARDKVLPTGSVPPSNTTPTPVQCYVRYAGATLQAVPAGVLLP